MPASQSGVFNTQQFTNAGTPLVGGRLYTYVFGTTTLKTAYTDAAGSIPHTYTSDGLGGQYLALDARGELPAPLYLTAGSYDIALKRSDASTVWTKRADATAIASDYLSLTAPSGASLVGFLPAGTGAVSTTALAKLRQRVTFEDFGAVGDGVADDTSALLAAITYLSPLGGTVKATGGKTYNYSNIAFPPGTTTAIIIEGYGATFRKTSAAGNGFYLRGTAGPGGPTGGKRRGAGMFGGRFTHAVTQTSGATIFIEDSEHTVVKDVEIEVANIGVFVKNSFDTHIKGKNYIRSSVTADIYLQGTGTTPTTIDTYIDGTLGEGVSGNITKVGLVVDSGVSGVYASNCDFTQGLNGARIANTIAGTPRPEFLFFSQVLCDTNSAAGWDVPGDCVGVFYTTCWGATAGSSGFNLGNGTGHFLTNCQAFNNSANGVSLSGAAEVHVSGGLFSGNSTGGANVSSGIAVVAGGSGFSVKNVRSGNVAGVGSGTQRHGISIAAGASDAYQLLNNDTRGNGTSSINDLGTGVSKRLHNNQGFNPRAFMGVVTTPATGVGLSNPFGTDASVYIVGGAITAIEINGSAGFVATGVTTGHVRVPAGAQIRLTYTGSPTTTWIGD